MRRIFIFFSLILFVCSNAQEPITDTISNKLEEVVVERNTKEITFNNGTIKVDVANSNLQSSSTTIDLLAKLPKLQISTDKTSVSVIGKGNALIYIDNQAVTMDEVNSLSVADIKYIEIISNPSSKYEANGRALILITRKRSKKEGFTIDFSESASFKKSFNNYLGINSSIKKSKVEIKTNFNYNQLNPWESNGISTELTTSDFYSNYLAVALTKRLQLIFGGGIFYKINEDDYWSFTLSDRIQKNDFGIHTDSYYTDNSIENNVITRSENVDDKSFVNLIVNYSKNVKRWNTVVFSGIQYSNYSQNGVGWIENNYNTTSFVSSQSRNQEYDIEVFSGRMDVEKKFKEDSKLEIGILNLQSTTTSGLTVYNYETNSTASSLYDYNEKNGAAYVQYFGTMFNANYSVGIRAEKTNVKGKLNTESNFLIDKKYINLFPKMQVEIPIDSTKILTLNYSKSIIRPNYSATTQGSTYINPYFVFTNNIDLNPTLADEISINFQRKESSIALHYSKAKNAVYYGFDYDYLSNALIFKPTNFDKETNLSLEISFPFKHKFWSVNTVLSSSITSVEDDTAIRLSSKPSFYFFMDQTFELPKKYVFGINSWGITKRNEGVFIRNELFIFNMSLSKRFFANWDCSLNYNDIFRNMNIEERLNINSINTNATYFTDTNEFSISLRYYFGKSKDSAYKEKVIDESSSRIR